MILQKRYKINQDLLNMIYRDITEEEKQKLKAAKEIWMVWGLTGEVGFYNENLQQILHLKNSLPISSKLIDYMYIDSYILESEVI